MVIAAILGLYILMQVGFMTNFTHRVNASIGVDLERLAPDAKAAAQGQLRLALIQSIAAAGAAFALIYTARNYQLTRRGQVTDRFTKALERLSSDKQYVRIGGVLALEQILHDAPDQSQDAQTVLQNFLLEHTPRAGDEWAETPEPGESMAPEVQTALNALGKASRYAALRVRLEGRSLVSLDFRRLDLMSADFNRSDLRGSDMEKAHLWGVNMNSADLRRCDMRGAVFVTASFRKAQLQYARTENACFAYAFMKYARFTDVGDDWATREVDFRHATLTASRMEGMRFMDCDFRHADLSGASLQGAVLSNCQLNKANLSGANFCGADLSSVKGLKRRQIASAKTDEETRLPADLL
ncbi:pentapeptide repeat-containing protein [Streptomyces sp. NPDC058335]|uniref:pentapeptide repeat-containing protein n=1 Tax=Streptomyces sp. NPDC058335 TaxID=3346451 RepID=UPI00365D9FAB